MSLSTQNTLNIAIPKIDFDAIKIAVLGNDYELNLTIVDAKKIQQLNAMYRNIDKPTDILSFPLSKKEGEIYICPEETKIAAKEFHKTYENFFAYLFLHGCTHLKGYDHGRKMDVFEAKIAKKIAL